VAVLTIAAGPDIHHPVYITLNVLVNISSQFQMRAAGFFKRGGV
jgi:hypothetical protein